jgi:hypothetical protein
MRVKITANTTPSGRFQVCAFPDYRLNQGYCLPIFTEEKEARDCLRSLRFEESEIEQTFKMLEEVGPAQPLAFPIRNIDDRLLFDIGFRI